MTDKVFNIQYNVGASKYVINFHNGKDLHKDKSPFFGIKTFKNKKLFHVEIKNMLRDGYKQTN